MLSTICNCWGVNGKLPKAIPMNNKRTHFGIADPVTYIHRWPLQMGFFVTFTFRVWRQITKRSGHEKQNSCRMFFFSVLHL
jgi:hypothetical protein